VKTSSSTAARIRDVALGMIAEVGYAAISMEDVRREANVSNGSLYHHFPSKAALAAGLYVDGMGQCQSIILDALATSGDAHDGVERAVLEYLVWIDGHRDIASLVFADLPDQVLLASEPDFSTANRRYVDAVRRWLADHAREGRIIDAPFEVVHALWIGPAQEYSRHWVRGRTRARPRRVAPDLAAAAWRSLRGDRGAPRG